MVELTLTETIIWVVLGIVAITGFIRAVGLFVIVSGIGIVVLGLTLGGSLSVVTVIFGAILAVMGWFLK